VCVCVCVCVCTQSISDLSPVNGRFLRSFVDENLNIKMSRLL